MSAYRRLYVTSNMRWFGTRRGSCYRLSSVLMILASVAILTTPAKESKAAGAVQKVGAATKTHKAHDGSGDSVSALPANIRKVLAANVKAMDPLWLKASLKFVGRDQRSTSVNAQKEELYYRAGKAFYRYSGFFAPSP